MSELAKKGLNILNAWGRDGMTGQGNWVSEKELGGKDIADAISSFGNVEQLYEDGDRLLRMTY